MSAAVDAKYTKVDDIPKIIGDTRKIFNSGRTRPLAFRKEQLLALATGIRANENKLLEAMRKDIRKATFDGMVAEIAMCLADIARFVDHLEDFAKPESAPTDIVFKFDTAQIRKEPYGLALIIGAWNYPVQLTLVPLVGAIAAGNCAIIKPSELSFNTALAVAEVVENYLDNECYRVINGGVAETSKVLEQRFDIILYTGGTSVGRVIMQAAVKHLTPVVLELGGKSPCIVDDDATLETAGRRIAWGRFLNAGQTCVAPDYILCKKELQEPLVASMKKALKEFYGDDVKSSPDYGRVVNARHFQRLCTVMNGNGNGKKVVGGETDEKDLFIAPTIFTDSSPDGALMQDEIFGPLLPIVPIESLDKAIEFINAREKPLALYIFTNTKKNAERVLNETSSGGVVVNDVIVHAAIDSLPFGGVGCSGMGAYHGKYSFDTFSHQKATVIRSSGLESLNSIRYPPFTDGKLSLVRKVLYASPTSPTFKLVYRAAVMAIIALVLWQASKRLL